jgi:hypothetical protein
VEAAEFRDPSVIDAGNRLVNDHGYGLHMGHLAYRWLIDYGTRIGWVDYRTALCADADAVRLLVEACLRQGWLETTDGLSFVPGIAYLIRRLMHRARPATMAAE